MKRDYLRLGFDIDGTILKEDSSFESTEEIDDCSSYINCLHQEGHKITLFTSRPWSMFEKTREQLYKINLKYDVLIMGKPSFDFLIDDRNIEFEGRWNDEFITTLSNKIKKRMDEPRWAKEF